MHKYFVYYLMYDDGTETWFWAYYGDRGDIMLVRRWQPGETTFHG